MPPVRTAVNAWSNATVSLAKDKGPNEHDESKHDSFPQRDAENPKDRIGIYKPPLHLIPPAAEILESWWMGLGAKKYGAFNWRKAPVKASTEIPRPCVAISHSGSTAKTTIPKAASRTWCMRACLGILLDAWRPSSWWMIDRRRVSARN